MAINFIEDQNNLDSNNLLNNKINRQHNFFASYGFIWLVMLVISIISLVTLFNSSKTEKNSASLIVADSAIIVEDLTKDNPLAHNSITSLLQSNLQQKEENIASKSIVLEDPKQVKVLAEDKNESNNLALLNTTDNNTITNPIDSPITTILKQEKEVQQEQNFSANNTQNLNNNTELEKNIKTNLSYNNSNSTTTPIIHNKINKANTTPVTTTNTILNNKVAANTVNNVWLVNIYSTANANKNDYNSIVKSFQLKASNLLNNAYFYALETNVNNKITYRISVANKSSNGHYINKQDATAFCNSLKNVAVDCFVSSVELSSLSNNNIVIK